MVVRASDRLAVPTMSSEGPDLYAVLGVSKGATPEQIRNGFKDQAMINHPDRGGNQTVYSQIQTAYETLSDPGKRAAYDAGKGGASGGSAAKQYGESFAGAVVPNTKMDISQQVLRRVEAVLPEPLLVAQPRVEARRVAHLVCRLLLEKIKVVTKKTLFF